METIDLLLFEDNEEDINLILAFLAKRFELKFTYKVVCTKPDFEEALNKEKFDVVLCKHPLPQCYAESSLRSIRMRKPFLPFIMISAESEESTIKSFINTGVDNYVMKNNLLRLPSAIIKAIEVNRHQFYLAKNYAVLKERAFVNQPGL